MQQIEISITNRRARLAASTKYICGNSDFVIVFSFDDEWDRFAVKTARFQWNERYVDVVFEGCTCPVPVLEEGSCMEIGVYAGLDVSSAVLYVTTPAFVPMEKSIRSRGGVAQEPPVPGVYDQITALLNDTAELTLGARNQAVQASGEAKSAAEAASDYAADLADARDTAISYGSAAVQASKTAEEMAQLCEMAKNNMVYVSFTVDPDGSVYVEHAEALGDIAFLLTDNGNMEVDLAWQE